MQNPTTCDCDWNKACKTDEKTNCRVRCYYKVFLKRINLNKIKMLFLIELTFLKVLVLIGEVHQNSAFFCRYFQKNYLSFTRTPASNNQYLNLNNIAILNIRDIDYHSAINRTSNCESPNPLQNADLKEKSGPLQNMTFLYCV